MTNNDDAAVFSLVGGNIHVWNVRPQRLEKTVHKWRRLLSQDEVQRADQFHFSRDQLSFTVTRGILRSLLGRYTQTPAEHVQFDYNAFGKPMMRNCQNTLPIQFNVTHPTGISLLVFSRIGEVGVDVECSREGIESDQMAELVFSASQLSEFLRLVAIRLPSQMILPSTFSGFILHFHLRSPTLPTSLKKEV